MTELQWCEWHKNFHREEQWQWCNTHADFHPYPNDCGSETVVRYVPDNEVTRWEQEYLPDRYTKRYGRWVELGYPVESKGGPIMAGKVKKCPMCGKPKGPGHMCDKKGKGY